MKCTFLVFVFLTVEAFSQEPSDYYNKPVREQEVRERIGICWDTTVIHKSGFKQCYREVSHWIDKNRDKYGFLSVAFNKDSGVVQITLLSDCRALRAQKVTDYYLVLISHSNSFTTSFENIQPSSKACRATFRNSIKTEIIHTILNLPDSVWYAGHLPNLGYQVDAPSNAPQPHGDSTIARVFEAMKADSIRVTNLIKHKTAVADSIAQAEAIARKSEAPLDTISIQKEIDSIYSIVEIDSGDIHKRDIVIFKKQPTVLEDTNISVGTHVECLEFLLAKKLRKASAGLDYLTALKKYCSEKQSYYYVLRKIANEKDKFVYSNYFKICQSECTRVQALMDKLSVTSGATESKPSVK